MTDVEKLVWVLVEPKEPETWTFDCGGKPRTFEGAVREALDGRPREWPSRLLVAPDVALAMWGGGMFPLPGVAIEVMKMSTASAVLVYPDGGRVYLTNYRDR